MYNIFVTYYDKYNKENSTFKLKNIEKITIDNNTVIAYPKNDISLTINFDKIISVNIVRNK